MNENEKKELREVAADICDLLEIPVPKIQITKNAKLFYSEQAPARTNFYEDKGKVKIEVLILDRMTFDKLSYIKFLAHELRHCYQFSVFGEEMFKRFIPQGHLSDDEYSAQSFEVDADAFSEMYLEAEYGAEWRYARMSSSNIQLREKRKTELIDEYYF